MELLQDYPQLLKNSALKKELIRAKSLDEKQKLAMKEEFLRTQKYIEDSVQPSGTLKAQATGVNVNGLEAARRGWQKTGEHPNPDWRQYMENTRRNAILSGQFLLAQFVTVAIPSYPDNPEIKKQVEKLLTKQQD